MKNFYFIGIEFLICCASLLLAGIVIGSKSFSDYNLTTIFILISAIFVALSYCIRAYRRANK
jgi:hypothetical protein